MTIDEAIKHCEEVAENYRFQRDDAADINDVGTASDCQQCADDHEQLAEWLKELKELRNSVGAFKLTSMKDALNLISDLRQRLFSSEKDLREAKRLLRLAFNDIAWLSDHSVDELGVCSIERDECEECPLYCGENASVCGWRYQVDVLKIL